MGSCCMGCFRKAAVVVVGSREVGREGGREGGRERSKNAIINV
jgi:hypothetical protein